MSKKRILGIVTFIVLIVSSLLLLTGCPQHVDSLYGLKVTDDGTGGAMVVWEEVQRPPEAKPGEAVSTGHIFTQKINSEGELEWGDGVLVYTTPENTYPDSPQIISDSSGGAIVVWQQIFSGQI
ncbi:MAG: hypothetical protein WC370_01915 [Dehalococcoidales bacterium]|jgi:hypothetical protein